MLSLYTSFSGKSISDKFVDILPSLITIKAIDFLPNFIFLEFDRSISLNHCRMAKWTTTKCVKIYFQATVIYILFLGKSFDLFFVWHDNSPMYIIQWERLRLASYFDMGKGKWMTAISTMLKTAISTMLKFMTTFMDKRNGYFDSLVLASRIIAMIDFLDIDFIYFFPDFRFWLRYGHGILLET